MVPGGRGDAARADESAPELAVECRRRGPMRKVRFPPVPLGHQPRTVSPGHATMYRVVDKIHTRRREPMSTPTVGHTMKLAHAYLQGMERRGEVLRGTTDKIIGLFAD